MEKIEISLKETFKRLVKEFWLALVLSISWTVLKTCFFPAPNIGSEFVDTLMYSISVFVVALGVTTYITGHFWRLKRQGAQEKGIDITLNEIKNHAFETINYVTGGISIVHVICDQGAHPIFRLRHTGKYPIPRLLVKIHDVYGGMTEYYQIPMTMENVSIPLEFQIPSIPEGDEKTFVFTILTPNASQTGVRQEYILRNKGGVMLRATKAVLMFNGKTVVDSIFDPGVLKSSETEANLFKYL